VLFRWCHWQWANIPSTSRYISNPPSSGTLVPYDISYDNIIIHSLWYTLWYFLCSHFVISYVISCGYDIIVMLYHSFYDVIDSIISHTLWSSHGSFCFIIVFVISYNLWCPILIYHIIINIYWARGAGAQPVNQIDQNCCVQGKVICGGSLSS
jgi:hypothetical protein